MATLAQLIAALTADAVTATADAAALTAAQTKQTTDLATQATDDTALVTALTTTGPVAVVSADGTAVLIYQAPAGTPAPGYTVTSYPLASTVTAPGG